MNNTLYKNLILLTGLCFIYVLLFYFITNYQLKLDYYCFYYAAQALLAGENPYQVLIAKNLSTLPRIPVNLNPPIVIALFTPLAKLNVYTSISLWFFSSIIMGLTSMILACRLLFSKPFLKKYQLSFCLVYLLLFSTLMNTWIVQIATVTGLGLIGGYYLYQQGRYKLAAMVWGIIIALKIFPGLLFFYVLRHKHYNMLSIMAVTVCAMWLMPVIVFGIDVYTHYFHMLPKVLWYGSSWNASLYGFLFRLLVDVYHPDNLIFVQCLSGVVCMGCFGWYLNTIYSIESPHDKSHQSFCLTVVVMLLISPLGWMYYFSILLFPILITWSQIILKDATNSRVMLWLVCLFLLNFPVDCIQTHQVKTLDKLTICSFYFYGLLLLTYLIATYDNVKHNIVSSRYHRVNHPTYVPRLVRGIQGSRSGIESLDPADKPWDVGNLGLPCDMERIHNIQLYQNSPDVVIHVGSRPTLHQRAPTIEHTKVMTVKPDYFILPIGVILGFGILLLSMSFIWRITSTTPITAKAVSSLH